jgi:hypothetical protein
VGFNTTHRGPLRVRRFCVAGLSGRGHPAGSARCRVARPGTIAACRSPNRKSDCIRSASGAPLRAGALLMPRIVWGRSGNRPRGAAPWAQAANARSLKSSERTTPNSRGPSRASARCCGWGRFCTGCCGAHSREQSKRLVTPRLGLPARSPRVWTTCCCSPTRCRRISLTWNRERRLTGRRVRVSRLGWSRGRGRPGQRSARLDNRGILRVRIAEKRNARNCYDKNLHFSRISDCLPQCNTRSREKVACRWHFSGPRIAMLGCPGHRYRCTVVGGHDTRS